MTVKELITNLLNCPMDGIVVRDDIEEPYEMIIKLDNGRYIRGVECQYRYVR